jgi:hypothetical protein
LKNSYISYIINYINLKNLREGKMREIDKLLFKAVEENKIDDVNQHIKDGANLLARNETGKTVLHIVKIPEIAKLLIDKGAAVDGLDEHGDTPLLNASLFPKRSEVIEVFIKNGANIGFTNEEGITPLHKAASLGCSLNVAKLIKAGADIHAESDNGSKPIHHAIRGGSMIVCQQFLNAEFNINDHSHRTNTILHEAMDCKSLDLLNLFFKSGQRIDFSITDTSNEGNIITRIRNEITEHFSDHAKRREFEEVLELAENTRLQQERMSDIRVAFMGAVARAEPRVSEEARRVLEGIRMTMESPPETGATEGSSDDRTGRKPPTKPGVGRG